MQHHEKKIKSKNKPCRKLNLFEDEQDIDNSKVIYDKKKIKENYLNQLLLPESDDIIKPEAPKEMRTYIEKKYHYIQMNIPFVLGVVFFCFVK